MNKKCYRLFISHSWSYSDAYEKILEFLEQEKICFYDHSVPKDDPIHTNGSDKELEEAIEAKIKGVSGVIILAGVYATYSKWINKEIKIAKKYNKPIIAVKHWGAQKVSQVVKDNADELVAWQALSIANAIKKWC